MAKTPKLRLLKDKQRDIEDQMARLKGMLAELEVQASELKIAERVLTSLSIDDEDDGATAPTVVAAVGSAAGVGHAGGVANGHNESEPPSVRKPDDIPTMPEMIRAAIENSAVTGRGLEPKQMAEYIDKRWWPGVQPNSVGPIAWRMYKRRELAKRGGRYYLPNPGNQAAEGEP